MNVPDQLQAIAQQLQAIAQQLRPPTPGGAPPLTDIRAAMPHNSAPDDPWLKARHRTDWWQRPLSAIRRLTVHHIGSNATAQQVAGYITKPKSQGGKGLPRTQYHYHVMPDGEVLWLLDLTRAPWHDSGGDENTGISIGLHGALHTRKPPAAQLVAAVQLCAWLMQAHAIGPDNVNGHDEWARRFTGAGTQCPGWTPGGWRAEFFGLLNELSTLSPASSFAVQSVDYDESELDALSIIGSEY